MLSRVIFVAGHMTLAKHTSTAKICYLQVKVKNSIQNRLTVHYPRMICPQLNVTVSDSW